MAPTAGRIKEAALSREKQQKDEEEKKEEKVKEKGLKEEMRKGSQNIKYLTQGKEGEKINRMREREIDKKKKLMIVENEEQEK